MGGRYYFSRARMFGAELYFQISNQVDGVQGRRQAGGGVQGGSAELTFHFNDIHIQIFATT